MKNILRKLNEHFLSKAWTILLVISVMAATPAMAQVQVSGVVYSETADPLPGVTVIESGTTNGVVTDIDGKYSMKVSSESASLVFSFVGYMNKTESVSGRSVIDANMEVDVEQLEEVVVVGYGSIKKSHLTGAVAQVSGGDITAVQSVRVDDALAGKLPGVYIQNQNGEPGADPKIQIRAASSISGNSNPLVVVDGYPISGTIATINPNDIESLEVLKDAASAAIYGSRGANGVILITTKKGKSGKPTLSYSGYMSTSSKYRDNILMDGNEWGAHARAEIAAGNWDVSQVDPDFLEYRLSAYEDSPDVQSVEDYLFQNGFSQSHNINMSGGTDNVNYFASAGYQNTEGVVITQGFEKYNARLNVDAKLGDKFKTGLNMNGFVSDRDMLGTDMRDLLRAYPVHPVHHTEASIAFVQDLNEQAIALGLDPFDNGYQGGIGASSIYDLEPGMTANDWHYGRANNGIGGSGDNGPASKLEATERWQKTFFINASTYLQYEIIKGLNLKTMFGADLQDTRDFTLQGAGFDARARVDQTTLDETWLKNSSWLSENTLSYSKTLGKHDIAAVVGFEFQNRYWNGIRANGTAVPEGEIVNFNLLAPKDITVTEREEVVSRRSVFGRLNYAYDNRYLATVSVRRDGDSRFGENNRFETFPALSLGWNVHNEAFFPVEAISTLKLRFSTGSLGTASFLGSYDALSLLSPQPTELGTGFLIPANVANPDLTWQTNTETNYGVDLGILGNRFTLGIDYYTSDIEDILINRSISEISGTSSVVLNTGDVRSSGLELNLNAAIIEEGDFTWNVNANFSTVSTEITDLGGLDALPDQIYGQSGRGPVFRNYVGGQIGEMWGLETIGEVEMLYLEDGTRHPNNKSGESYVVDQQSPGEEGYGEIDRTRTVEEGGDLVKIGQNTPDFYWGFSSSMNYKSFDMSFQFQGAQGGEVYNIDPLYYGSQWGGRLVDSFDADDDGLADHNGEHYIVSSQQTDAVLQDASYIALRNLTIGYTFSPELLGKVGVSSARLYVASSNLLYIMGDDYTSYNPEGVETTNTDYAGPTTYGVQVGASPIVRSFTLGLNVNF